MSYIILILIFLMSILYCAIDYIKVLHCDRIGNDKVRESIYIIKVVHEKISKDLLVINQELLTDKERLEVDKIKGILNKDKIQLHNFLNITNSYKKSLVWERNRSLFYYFYQIHVFLFWKIKKIQWSYIVKGKLKVVSKNTSIIENTLINLGSCIKDEINNLQDRRVNLPKMLYDLRKLVEKAAQQGIDVTEWGKTVHHINDVNTRISADLTVGSARQHIADFDEAERSYAATYTAIEKKISQVAQQEIWLSNIEKVLNNVNVPGLGLAVIGADKTAAMKSAIFADAQRYIHCLKQHDVAINVKPAQIDSAVYVYKKLIGVAVATKKIEIITGEPCTSYDKEIVELINKIEGKSYRDVANESSLRSEVDSLAQRVAANLSECTQKYNSSLQIMEKHSKKLTTTLEDIYAISVFNNEGIIITAQAHIRTLENSKTSSKMIDKWNIEASLIIDRISAFYADIHNYIQQISKSLNYISQIYYSIKGDLALWKCSKQYMHEFENALYTAKNLMGDIRKCPSENEFRNITSSINILLKELEDTHITPIHTMHNYLNSLSEIYNKHCGVIQQECNNPKISKVMIESFIQNTERMFDDLHYKIEYEQGDDNVKKAFNALMDNIFSFIIKTIDPGYKIIYDQRSQIIEGPQYNAGENITMENKSAS